MVKKRQNGSPNITEVDSVHQRGQRNLPAPVSELPGPVFGDFGPLWARPGPGRSEEKEVPEFTCRLEEPQGKTQWHPLWSHCGSHHGIFEAPTCMINKQDTEC